MAYYLKLKILSGYNVYTEMREIEFFNCKAQIPISDLSIVYCDNQYDSAGWCIQNIINGNIQDNTGWCSSANYYPSNIIIKSNKPFNRFLLYNDSQNAYPIKEIEYYYLKSKDIPSVGDIRWKLVIQRLNGLNNIYENKQCIINETFNANLFLVENNNKVLRPLENNTYNVLGNIPIKEGYFNEGDFLNLDFISKDMINKLDDKSYNIVMYKQT